MKERIWLEQEDMKKAEELMKKWESEGCRNIDIEKKLLALQKYFNECLEMERLKPFKAQVKVSVDD